MKIRKLKKKYKHFVKPLGAGGGGGEERRCDERPFLRFDEFEKGDKKIWFEKGSNAHGKEFSFSSTIIPPSGTQEMTFEHSIQDLIEHFLNGFNVKIIAYGQTGSGKTHTLFGPPNLLSTLVSSGDYSMTHPDLGLFPRAAASILKELKKQEEKEERIKFVLSSSLLEMHVMTLLDLLNDKSFVQFDTECSKPSGQSEWFLFDNEDVMKLSEVSEKRETGATLMNESSSRSHCFLTLRLTKYNIEKEMLSTNYFTFCDLGGSERIHEAHGKDIGPVAAHKGGLEGLCINACLTGLVFQAEKMAKQKRVLKLHEVTSGYNFICSMFSSMMIPFFLGTDLTRMIITVSQTPKNDIQSSYALKFGQFCSKCPCAPKKSKQHKNYEKYRNQIEGKLQKERKDYENGLKKNVKNKRIMKKRQSRIQMLQLDLKILKILGMKISSMNKNSNNDIQNEKEERITQRNINEEISKFLNDQKRKMKKQKATKVALHQKCTNPQCMKKAKFRCAICKKAAYCSESCNVQDNNRHCWECWASVREFSS